MASVPSPTAAASRRLRRGLAAVCAPALLLLAGATLSAAPKTSSGRPASRTTNATAQARSATLPAPSTCQDGATGCVCVTLPKRPAAACWTSGGDAVSGGGCVAGRQCCAGAWSKAGACGACRCEVPNGGGCLAEGDRARSCGPAFSATIATIDEALAAKMRGVTWKPGCPVPLADLRAIHMNHWTDSGTVAQGTLIVAAAVAPAVRDAFARLYRHRFPIRSIRPAHVFGGSDDASMAVDNTSAFNCRPITGGKAWSEHAYGRALDLNPLRNPYVRGRLVLPRAGAAFADRARVGPGVIVAPGPVVGAFDAIGWHWGGRWRGYQDYQHFSSTGR